MWQFAKHMKVDEQVSFLKNKKSGIGVGTPARLTELVNNGKARVKRCWPGILTISRVLVPGQFAAAHRRRLPH